VKVESEIIDLVSEGYFYPPDHQLSSGKLKIYPVTAQFEEMLGNTNLIKRNLLERQFLSNIIDGEFNYDDLLACDRDSILLNIRIANYGASAKTKNRCDDCDKDFESDMSFALKSKPFDFSKHTRGKNELRYRFQKTNKELVYKLPTVGELDIYAKVGWLAFLKTITLSIESVKNTDDFYDNVLPASDSAAFRSYFDKYTPGYQNLLTLQCPTCKMTRNSKLEITADIFGIGPESRMNIHSEIFDLCYYSNGAFTQEGVYKMPTLLRSFYIKKLVDAKKAEADAHNKAASSKPSTIARPPTVKK
jgi:hypothetical protein